MGVTSTDEPCDTGSGASRRALPRVGGRGADDAGTGSSEGPVVVVVVVVVVVAGAAAADDAEEDAVAGTAVAGTALEALRALMEVVRMAVSSASNGTFISDTAA